jgi:hypothetical protein
MRDNTRIVAVLQVHLEFAENQAERLFALAPHIEYLKAKQACLDLAKEAETEVAQIRERLRELQGDA